MFTTVTATPLADPPAWLTTAAWLWLPIALAWVVVSALRRRLAVAEFGALALAFLLLPPLPTVALYFVAVHAPQHVAALIAERRASRVRRRGRRRGRCRR